MRSYTASSLEEYLSVVSYINDREQIEQAGANKRNSNNRITPLWYRGVKRQDYNLIPTLLRESSGVEHLDYTKDRLKEEYRFQHFRSKCNQLVEKSPDSKIEWMEIMQHFCTNTRLMDWSESAITGLLFALEYFIQPGKDKDLQYKRSVSTPAVWIVNPFRLNEQVFNSFSADDRTARKLIGCGIDDIIPWNMQKRRVDDFKNRMYCRLRDGKDRYFRDEDDPFIQGIVSLSALESDREANSHRLFYLLDKDEFNPFFYLLLRYYSDGTAVEINTLPPLAIVHPYHSSRIQAQRGVFTVSPHYIIEKTSAKTP